MIIGYILLGAFISSTAYILGHRRGFRHGHARGWAGGQEAIKLRNDELARRRSRISG